MRAPPSWSTCLPKAPPPNITTSGVRISAYEFGVGGLVLGTNLPSITLVLFFFLNHCNGSLHINSIWLYFGEFLFWSRTAYLLTGEFNPFTVIVTDKIDFISTILFFTPSICHTLNSVFAFFIFFFCWKKKGKNEDTHCFGRYTLLFIGYPWNLNACLRKSKVN